jgi:hypothetical protein
VTERDVQELRDEVARLLSRNLELEEKIEVLQRDRTELAVEDIARSLVGSTRLAEQAMADESDGGVRYVIPRAEIAVRGLLSRRGDAVALRFPGAEDRVGGDRLSKVSMVVAHLPPTEPGPLQVALERAQTTALAWRGRRGREAASAIATHATHLLALRPRWGDGETSAGLGQLAKALSRFGDAIAPELAPERRDRYRAASKALADVADRAAAVGRISDEELHLAAAAIEELVAALGN